MLSLKNKLTKILYRLNIKYFLVLFSLSFPFLASGGFFNTDSAGGWIAQAYQWGVGLALFLGMGTIVFAGILWITSRGEPDSITKAKEMIYGAVAGIIIALCSFLLLRFFDSRLVDLAEPGPPPPTPPPEQ